MNVFDFTKIQKEFAEQLLGSVSKAADNWAEAVKTAGSTAMYDAYRNLASEWLKPQTFSHMMDSAGFAVKFREMTNLLSKDLPDLMNRSSDPKVVKEIKAKWDKAYEDLVTEFFGIPNSTQIEKLSRMWTSFFSNFSSSGQAMPDPFKMFQSQTEPFGFELFKLWQETYDQSVGKLFRLPGIGMTREYEERTKKALDAQMRFLNSLPDLHQHILTASKKATERVIEAASSMDVAELTPESLEAFYRLWITKNEDTYIELFRSESFCRTLADTLHRGLEAKKKVSSVLADSLAAMSIPSERDLDEVYETLYKLKKRVRSLEREVNSLKAGIEKHSQPEVLHEAV